MLQASSSRLISLADSLLTVVVGAVAAQDCKTCVCKVRERRPQSMPMDALRFAVLIIRQQGRTLPTGPIRCWCAKIHLPNPAMIKASA